MRRELILKTEFNVVNVDKLTYAGNLDSVSCISNSDKYIFEQADICNENALTKLFSKYQPTIVMHLAAESHVDRSIDSPNEFIDTNMIGTFKLLEAANYYF